MIQTYKPQTDLVIADIEALRNGAGGISTGTLWKHAEEYPELSNLAKKGIETFRKVTGRTMSKAGYIRLSSKSTYWFAPTIKDEIEEILGEATIFSMNRFTDAIEAEPGKYPGIENIFALEQRQARQKMSNMFRALGYKRWNSTHNKRTNCGVWTK